MQDHSPALCQQAKPEEEQEDLDFMFDEEIDHLEGGRKNTFTDW